MSFSAVLDFAMALSVAAAIASGVVSKSGRRMTFLNGFAFASNLARVNIPVAVWSEALFFVRFEVEQDVAMAAVIRTSSGFFNMAANYGRHAPSSSGFAARANSA